ncbi:MAG: anti-sigma regulatory factor (Ser/Thr protein kinase) [Hyphomicrobiaceae bacterium]|jgi:anti-sigma regulatory factor (Ser/Thr protein kinase)
MNHDDRFNFPADGSVLRKIRAKVRDVAGRHGAEPSVCDSLALVVDELVNNAIEHGASYRKGGQELGVCIGLDGEHLVIEFFDPEMPSDQVKDLAAALAETANGMPSLDSERGRGLFLLSVYLEDLLAEVASQGGLRLVGNIKRK